MADGQSAINMAGISLELASVVAYAVANQQASQFRSSVIRFASKRIVPVLRSDAFEFLLVIGFVLALPGLALGLAGGVGLEWGFAAVFVVAVHQGFWGWDIVDHLKRSQRPAQPPIPWRGFMFSWGAITVTRGVNQPIAIAMIASPVATLAALAIALVIVVAKMPEKELGERANLLAVGFSAGVLLQLIAASM